MNTMEPQGKNMPSRRRVGTGPCLSNTLHAPPPICPLIALSTYKCTWISQESITAKQGYTLPLATPLDRLLHKGRQRRPLGAHSDGGIADAWSKVPQVRVDADPPTGLQIVRCPARQQGAAVRQRAGVRGDPGLAASTGPDLYARRPTAPGFLARGCLCDI